MNLAPIENQFLLVDTNFLIYCSKFKRFFDAFLYELEEKGVSISVDETIKFEFLRGAANKQERDSLEKFLNLLTKEFTIPFNKELLIKASNISNYLETKKRKFISMTDCLLMAELEQYNSSVDKNRLFLVTSDHKDFAMSFLDRILLETIDAKGPNIFNIGIYTFNKEKYKKLKDDFNKDSK